MGSVHVCAGIKEDFNRVSGKGFEKERFFYLDEVCRYHCTFDVRGHALNGTES